AVVDISDALAEAILSTRSDAIRAADRDGLIRFWNPGAERPFGYSHNEAMSRSLDLIIPERLRERHWDGYRRVMETGKSRYGQGDVLSVPAIRKNGAMVSVEFTVVRSEEHTSELKSRVDIVCRLLVENKKSAIS